MDSVFEASSSMESISEASSLEYSETSSVEESSSEESNSIEESSSEESSSMEEESSSEESSSIEEDSSIETPLPCAHNWLEESRTQYCDKNGEVVWACDLCGDKRTESTNLLGHDEVIDLARSATCEFEGKSQGSHCKRCNEVLIEQQTYAKADHEYVEYSCKWCGLAILEFEERTNGYYCIGTKAKDARRIVIPDEYEGKPVVGIAKHSFGSRHGLNSLTIGKNVETIEAGSFDYCYNLVEVYDFSIAQVTKQDENMIDLENHVLDIYTEPCESKLHKDLDGYITYDWRGEVLFLGYKGVQPSDDTIRIPEGVTIVNWCSISPTKWAKKVIVSDTVKYIRRMAFYCAPNIETLTIGENVEKMDSNLFDANTALQSVIFNDIENWLVRFNIEGSQWNKLSTSLANPEENVRLFKPPSDDESPDFSQLCWKKVA